LGIKWLRRDAVYFHLVSMLIMHGFLIVLCYKAWCLIKPMDKF
jgi:hypothetical protein